MLTQTIDAWLAPVLRFLCQDIAQRSYEVWPVLRLQVGAAHTASYMYESADSAVMTVCVAIYMYISKHWCTVFVLPRCSVHNVHDSFDQSCMLLDTNIIIAQVQVSVPACYYFAAQHHRTELS